MTIRADTDELIGFLDSLAKVDPVAIGALIAARVPCNDALSDHSTVQTGDGEVGLLGILNGYAGTLDSGRYKGWGPIAAVIELDGRCTGFVRTNHKPPEDDSIENLTITIRAANILAKAGVVTIAQLRACTDAELMALDGFSKKNLLEIREALVERDTLSSKS